VTITGTAGSNFITRTASAILIDLRPVS